MNKPGWVSTSESYRDDPLTDDERYLAENYERARCIAYAEDKDADYSFDEKAVLELDGTWYLISTSGCSCPSPEEMWRIEAKGDLAAVRAALVAGDYEGYTLPKWAEEGILAAIDRELAA